MTQSYRSKILKRRGMTPTPYTMKPVPYAEAPSEFNKTTLMKLVESRLGEQVDILIWKWRKIDTVALHLGIDRSTVSKWRKQIGRRGKS